MSSGPLPGCPAPTAAQEIWYLLGAHQRFRVICGAGGRGILRRYVQPLPSTLVTTHSDLLTKERGMAPPWPSRPSCTSSARPPPGSSAHGVERRRRPQRRSAADEPIPARRVRSRSARPGVAGSRFGTVVAGVGSPGGSQGDTSGRQRHESASATTQPGASVNATPSGAGLRRPRCQRCALYGQV